MKPLTLVLISAAALSAGCKPTTAGAPGGVNPPQVPEVGIYTVAPRALAVTTELPGRTAAYQVAEVRPQVGGLIQKRLFAEGGDVKAGAQLYQIDAATYQAAHNSAKAALAKARANLMAAGPKVARYKELVAIEGVSRQEYDDAVAGAEQAKAEVEAAAAAVETARINLDYTRVAAPISGRISRSNVTPGALVTAGQATAMTTVQQLDPIYVDVTQSSTDLLRLKRDMEDGSLKRGGGQARVTLVLADGSRYAQPGKLQFADVTVDPGTGNVVLRAIFPNPRHDLLPGMFVRAIVESGVDERAILVPQQGVTRNPKGEATALVLNRQGKVEQRALVTGATVGDQWLVKSGLSAGDRVIVEGVQKVQPGASALAARTPAEPAAPAPARTVAAAAGAAPGPRAAN
ncbi:efflux RND transporter periplasmic adaptor subunit [Pseudoduganella namucuonensis]|uniref:Membrane fusion protein, multidrug efflux system n=1 Tax=Pseudoduganella namucuonensis TaxID=1035707 RepID=A0A1I7IY43_9BURK|nr:efflux RND transporter periplasmic adaptor subunit [Pseudoduganella namucuonensis]SFU77792.1 membrane fusion protein, multidrug efflux system [Pseudoduganella namucuonensis]